MKTVEQWAHGALCDFHARWYEARAAQWRRRRRNRNVGPMLAMLASLAVRR